MSYKYVIDSSAWFEYFTGTESGNSLLNIIETEPIATSIIAVAELADKFEREGISFAAHLKFIQSRAAIISLSVELALHAAKLKKEHRPQHGKFSLADGVHLATAHQENAILVTTDRDFSGVKNTMLV